MYLPIRLTGLQHALFYTVVQPASRTMPLSPVDPASLHPCGVFYSLSPPASPSSSSCIRLSRSSSSISLAPSDEVVSASSYSAKHGHTLRSRSRRATLRLTAGGSDGRRRRGWARAAFLHEGRSGTGSGSAGDGDGKARCAGRMEGQRTSRGGPDEHAVSRRFDTFGFVAVVHRGSFKRPFAEAAGESGAGRE